MPASPILSRSPTGGPAQPRVVLSIPVSPELRDRLARRAQDEGRSSLAAFVRDILVQAVRCHGESEVSMRELQRIVKEDECTITDVIRGAGGPHAPAR